MGIAQKAKIMKNKIHHLQSFFVIYFFYLSALSVFAAEHTKAASEAKELLFFRYDGGIFSRVQAAELLILNDGSGITTLHWRDEKSEKISSRLNPDELEATKTLVFGIDFFSQQQGTVAYTDAGICTLRISIDSKQNELRYDLLYPPMRQLTTFIYGLVCQSIAISDLEHQRDVYWVLGEVSLYDRGGQWPKAPQPKSLRNPLKKFIQKSENRQQLLWAVEALSRIMTPEEWMGFLSTELNDPNDARKTLLLEALSSHPFTSNIPRDHRDMLCPLFLKHLRYEYRNWSQFSKEKRQTYGSVIRFLGEQRYTIATPVLVEMIEGCYTDGTSWLGWSLPHMAGEAIEPLKHLLDSSNASIRAPAAEMLGKILVMDQPPPNNAISEKGREQILNRLKKEIAPKLEKLSKDDPDDWVRIAAKRSLQQIECGWNK